MGLWDGDAYAIAEQLRHLADTLRSPALAPCREGLEAMGDGHLPAAMTEAYAAFLHAYGSTEGALAFRHAKAHRCHKLAADALRWRHELQTRLERDRKTGVGGVVDLKRRLRPRLRAARAARTSGMLAFLRATLPELRRSRLGPGALATEPEFLDEGERLLAELHEAAGERLLAEEDYFAACAEAAAARARGREVSEILLADVAVLRAQGVLCSNLDLRILRQHKATRPAALRRKRAREQARLDVVPDEAEEAGEDDPGDDEAQG